MDWGFVQGHKMNERVWQLVLFYSVGNYEHLHFHFHFQECIFSPTWVKLKSLHSTNSALSSMVKESRRVRFLFSLSTQLGTCSQRKDLLKLFCWVAMRSNHWLGLRKSFQMILIYFTAYFYRCPITFLGQQFLIYLGKILFCWFVHLCFSLFSSCLSKQDPCKLLTIQSGLFHFF